ncbi:glycoside hydrolase family 43 protein [Xanthomonas citri pv. glycines]|uniref:glycoside hydrolase family 43 protein n=1 Tax=Xanthomonas TaxID=338 RepID=UPI00044CE93B|nr:MULTISPECIES: glycoside hydrolase family 43 protein [Xanthomonas]EWC49049.1 xylan 1,4-beta-xylosidase [Xanthomonas citri pv. glycines str. 8ra]QTK37100.1 glycoside hydrolase family 43 protein [Xanthomonas citri pv. glycines CFBP 2526]QTK41614.1 glycoside hydrolase family 43 protein [Xanthomonas citri pv. glycines]UIX78314.1 glycoside hydrolase family 43 protein [Xanthomonas citri pv. glycines]WLA22355.1 glycoside hydrolase family 43 protein [Xanthomonas citri pv. glycines]
MALLMALAVPANAQAQASADVAFDWFEYRGDDAVFATPLPAGHYRNPVLAGFYPDPSITRVGERYYLVNSTFTYFPAIPVLESTDLVHWTQIGNVVDRREQLDYDGLRMSRGMYAASIRHHDGRFYVVGTSVDSGGNFIASASNPAGPWSPLTWLPSIDGIDPSLFFDSDGSASLLNNGPPEGPPLYDGHRAIWMQRFDIAKNAPVGPRKVLLNGGVDLASKPIWIEGPHLYQRDGWYYLSCAEGGTGPQHSQVVLRSRTVWGPYAPAPNNPILTQRDLPAERAHPISNAGHVDLVDTPDGQWWAVFLASRPYRGDRYNTGRETFLLPVQWRDGWPSILPAGQPIPYIAKAPAGMKAPATQAPLSGNFVWHDDFDHTTLQREWLTVRVPKHDVADLRTRAGWLTLHADARGLDGTGTPAFLARRQQHMRFTASTALEVPTQAGISAGLAAFQNSTAWYALGIRRDGDAVQVFLDKRDGAATTTLAQARIPATAQLRLQISGDGGAYSFAFDADGRGWQSLHRNDDAGFLSTAQAGGFVGSMIGPFAQSHPDRSSQD